jgi:tetratricopeptide (TPR) repeat protein
MSAVADSVLRVAVENFVLAATWEGSLAILEAEPALASQAAVDLVASLIDEATQIGDERSARVLDAHKKLLERCIEEGTSNVLHNFRREHPRAETLDDILSTVAESSWEPADALRRIELCRRALAMVERAQDAELWARLQAALGTALLNSPIGDRRAQVEEAIGALSNALSVLDPALPERARALNNLGQAHEQVRWDQSDAHLEAAIVAYEHALELPPELQMPIERAETLNNLANAFIRRERGIWPENCDHAIELYRQALALLSRDEDPLEWARVQTNLGIALTARNRGEDLDVAIKALRGACKVLAASAAPVDWAIAQTHLGNALQRRAPGGSFRDLDEAILVYESALDALREQSAVSPRAATLVNLGNAFVGRASGVADLEHAIECYREALTVIDRDATPLEWARAQNNLGNALRRRARETRSATDAEQAISVYNEACQVLTLERTPIEYAQIKKNLGASYALLERVTPGEFAERALDAYREALAVRERAYGPNHPRVASLLYSMAKVQRETGDWPGTRASLERALAIDQEAGLRSPRMAKRYRRLATAAQEMRDLDAAERALEHALAIDQALHDSDHPDVFTDLTELGKVRRLLGKEDAAKGDLERAVGMNQYAYSSRAKMRAALVSLADVLQRAGDIAGAEKTLERAVVLDESLGHSGARIEDTLFRLAEVLASVEDTARSEETVDRAVQLSQSGALRDHPRLAAWLGMVSRLAEADRTQAELPPGGHGTEHEPEQQ